MHTVSYNTAFGPTVYKLPAVKDCLYHPQLPTFRRMDIDTAAHKLPDEHCRTTSKCNSDNFKSATVTLYKFPEKPTFMNPTNDIRQKDTCCGADQEKHITLFNESIKDYQSHLPFAGYSMRYLSPAVTGSWRYSLQQEPYVDRLGQRPVPANIYSRHRNLSSGIGVPTTAWRP